MVFSLVDDRIVNVLHQHEQLLGLTTRGNTELLKDQPTQYQVGPDFLLGRAKLGQVLEISFAMICQKLRLVLDNYVLGAELSPFLTDIAGIFLVDSHDCPLNTN